MPAKPILDIAVGLAPKVEPGKLTSALEPLGYEFRGDKGDDGGLLFVLEDRPSHRIAHVHAVPHGSTLWKQYLAFRDLLRYHPASRDAYLKLKRRLAKKYPHDRRTYTAGKDAFIEERLSSDAWW